MTVEQKFKSKLKLRNTLQLFLFNTKELMARTLTGTLTSSNDPCRV